jgi:predicted amidophosphoribosyltransferase
VAQTGLSATARRRNVRDAFMLSPLLSRNARAALSEGVIVLVDDVRTTGATLDACARVLKEAGAREVRSLTIAVRSPRGAQAGSPESNAPGRFAIANASPALSHAVE